MARLFWVVMLSRQGLLRIKTTRNRLLKSLVTSIRCAFCSSFPLRNFGIKPTTYLFRDLPGFGLCYRYIPLVPPPSSPLQWIACCSYPAMDCMLLLPQIPFSAARLPNKAHHDRGADATPGPSQSTH